MRKNMNYYPKGMYKQNTKKIMQPPPYTAAPKKAMPPSNKSMVAPNQEIASYQQTMNTPNLEVANTQQVMSVPNQPMANHPPMMNMPNSPMSHQSDHGPYPLVINIDKATEDNPYYRTTLWTGQNLQVTLMSINVGEDIGLEVHPELDQFIRIEEGCGLTQMGKTKDELAYQRKVDSDCALIIPAGTWHNLINIGDEPLKLYSIYAPPQHPYGTVHQTKAIAEEAEGHHH